MNRLNQQENAPFSRLDRVIRNQRWLAIANALVTFTVLMGAFGVVSSLVS